MGQIQNVEALATNELREDALRIAEVGFEAINTEKVVRDKVQVVNNELRIGDKTYNIAGRNIYFVGVGKCAIAGGRAIEEILGDSLTAGIALDVATHEQVNLKLTTIETYIGTHPLPSETNVQATKRIMEFLSGHEASDLVIMLISGGGSTLLCLPSASMTYLDESTLFEELTAKGTKIQDINTVRKHISLARGGALAAAAYPAEVVSLIVSDVPGNDIASVASGPTVLDSSTIADAKAILAKYDIDASAVEFTETPKEQKFFEKVTNVLFLSNQDALDAMKSEAEKRGYSTVIADSHYTGEARDIGHTVLEKLHVAPAKSALLYAGESTVTLGSEHGEGGLASPKPLGVGGRNQELALVALEYLDPDELILPFASDGHDNTTHAGAIADADTLAHAEAQNLSVTEYLAAHRSYDFFSATNDALVTGYTGSNVSDLIIALKK